MGLIFQIGQQICSYCNTPDKRQYKMISIFHPRIGVILLGSSEKDGRKVVGNMKIMDVNSYSRYTQNVPLLTPIQSAFAPPEDPRFPVRRLSYFDKSNSVIVTYYLCLLSVLILDSVSRTLTVLRTPYVFLPFLGVVIILMYKTKFANTGSLIIGNTGMNVRTKANEGFFIKWGEVSEFRVVWTLTGRMVEFDYRTVMPGDTSQVYLTRRLSHTREFRVVKLAKLLNSYRFHYSVGHVAL